MTSDPDGILTIHLLFINLFGTLIIFGLFTRIEDVLASSITENISNLYIIGINKPFIPKSFHLKSNIEVKK